MDIRPCPRGGLPKRAVLLGAFLDQLQVLVRSERRREEDRASLGVRKRVGQILQLVIGVQWDEDHSRLGRGQLDNGPIDGILRQQCDVVAALKAEVKQRLRQRRRGRQG